MTIGTSLFADLSSRSFNRLDGRIADLQGLVASGKNDPKLSADPVRAIRLSAATEQQELLSRFSENVDYVSSRLGQADATMEEGSNMLRRVREITLRAANDTLTPTDRDALVTELSELRNGLKDLGNARDSTGQALFGGYMVDGNAFEVVGGEVQYNGDNGRHTLRVSETATLPTGIDGASIFLSAKGENGPINVFEMIDDVVFALSPNSDNTRSDISSNRALTVDFQATRQSQTYTMSVSGPNGQAEVSAEMVDGVPYPMIDAINAQTAETGITARIGDDGRSVVLEGDGEVAVNSIESEDNRRAVLARVTDNGETPRSYELVGKPFSINTILDKTNDAIGHFADVRAELGAMGQVADWHKDAIDSRSVEVQKAVAGLEDVDIAKVVTELQSMLLSRSAAQQTFVKITQSNLFDYLR